MNNKFLINVWNSDNAPSGNIYPTLLVLDMSDEFVYQCQILQRAYKSAKAYCPPDYENDMGVHCIVRLPCWDLVDREKEANDKEQSWDEVIRDFYDYSENSSQPIVIQSDAWYIAADDDFRYNDDVVVTIAYNGENFVLHLETEFVVYHSHHFDFTHDNPYPVRKAKEFVGKERDWYGVELREALDNWYGACSFDDVKAITGVNIWDGVEDDDMVQGEVNPSAEVVESRTDLLDEARNIWNEKNTEGKLYAYKEITGTNDIGELMKEFGHSKTTVL